MQGKYFLIVPAVPVNRLCQGSAGGYNIGTPASVKFSVVYGGAKSRVFRLPSACLHRAELIPGL